MIKAGWICMAKSLLTCGFACIAVFLFSLIPYSYTQNNTSSLSNPVSPSTIFGYLMEVAPITENQNSTQIFDPEGVVYVSDRDIPNIQKFTSNGTFISSWGSEGEANGQFTTPWDVAVDKNDNEIYVPDYGNNRIQVFSTDGKLIRDFGGKGEGEGQFNHPAVIAFDGYGNVYVTDSDNKRVQVFSKNGTLITMFGGEGGGEGQFLKPESIAVDSKGRVYVADTANNNVQLFAPG
jgi:DNA-binding beta-propeller fold protein YncE